MFKMRMMACLLAAACGFSTNSAYGQGTPGKPGNNDQSNPTKGDQKAGAQMKDAMLATHLMLDGQKQIAVSKVAAQRAQNKAVKEFAAAEIKEHQDFKQKLEAIGLKPLVMISHAQDDSQTTPGDKKQAPATNAQDPTNPQGQGASGQAGPQGSPVHGILQVRKELAEQCTVSIVNMLNKKEEAKFDKAYIGTQLTAHMELWDTVQVFKKHASPDLRRVLEEAHPVIEQHLQRLHQIMGELEGTPSKTQSSSAPDR